MGKMLRGTADPEVKKEIKQLQEDKDLLETVVATGAVGGLSGAASELQELLLRRLKQKTEEEEASATKELERQKRRLMVQAQEAEKKNRNIAWMQQSCSHLDGLNQKRTGGQWNSDGRYVIYCLYCFKKYTNAPGGEPCPNHLIPDEMGGAVMEAVNRVGPGVQEPVGMV